MTTHTFQNLLSAAAQTPESTALEFMGQQIPYAALANNARKLAAGLAAQGVAEGASVGLMLPNIPHFVEALYGTWLHGNVVVPMNVLLTGPEVRYLIEDSKIRAIFVFEMFLPAVEAAIAELSDPPRVFVIGNAGARHTAYAALLEGEPVTPRVPSADEHVLTIYTSGTTGKPKGAVISNDNVAAQLDMTVDRFKTLPGDKALCVLPLFHVFALNAVLNLAIRQRTTVVLHPKFEVDAAVKSLQNDGITTFSGVPTMYFYILKHPEAASLRFPTLRHCVSGGAPMPVDVLRSFEDKFGVPIYEGYGLTETTVSVSCNHAGAKRIGSVGKPYAGVELRIFDDAGRDLPAGERGEIVIKSKNVMRGYLNRAEATADTIRDGFLYTGDIGYKDEDGFVFIVNRKKDMILKGGYNVYPREIEEVLYQLPEVAEAAVVGIVDAAMGEQVRAVIAAKPGMTLDEDKVRRHLAANLAKYKLPSEYVFRSELPKGPTGKILKRELRD